MDGHHADANTGVPLPHTTYYSVSDNRVAITLDDGGTGSLWLATKNEWLGLLDVRACASELSTADSTGNRSRTRAVSTSSYPVDRNPVSSLPSGVTRERWPVPFCRGVGQWKKSRATNATATAKVAAITTVRIATCCRPNQPWNCCQRHVTQAYAFAAQSNSSASRLNDHKRTGRPTSGSTTTSGIATARSAKAEVAKIARHAIPRCRWRSLRSSTAERALSRVGSAFTFARHYRRPSPCLGRGNIPERWPRPAFRPAVTCLRSRCLCPAPMPLQRRSRRGRCT
jgi:hypothetical protein